MLSSAVKAQLLFKSVCRTEICIQVQQQNMKEDALFTPSVNESEETSQSCLVTFLCIALFATWLFYGSPFTRYSRRNALLIEGRDREHLLLRMNNTAWGAHTEISCLLTLSCFAFVPFFSWHWSRRGYITCCKVSSSRNAALLVLFQVVYNFDATVQVLFALRCL